MLCARCGKDIPYLGKVCPYCHTDKSRDQLIQTLGLLGALCGAFLGYVYSGIGTAIAGFFVGMIGGMILVTTGLIKSELHKENPDEIPRVWNSNAGSPSVLCKSCRTKNDRSAKFCNNCGGRM
jgi:RNA polymerase subunit RPABC4/transcription elongation factor Spt4